MEELISVLVVSYNSENTILETLESIVNQTYGNLEIVVTDDNSKDNTVALVEEWKNSSNCRYKVKIVKATRNTGIPGNINRGLTACTGELIKIIAADDLLMPEAIQIYLQYFLHNSPKQIFVSKVNLFGEVTDVQIDYCEIGYQSICKSNQYKRLLVSNFIIAPSVGLLSKKMIFDVGMFDEKYPALDDYPFYLNLSKLGYSYKLIEIPLVKYRITSSSTGNGKSKRYMKSMSMFFFDKKLSLLFQNKMYFVAIKQSIRYGIMWIKSL